MIKRLFRSREYRPLRMAVYLSLALFALSILAAVLAFLVFGPFVFWLLMIGAYFLLPASVLIVLIGLMVTVTRIPMDETIGLVVTLLLLPLLVSIVALFFGLDAIGLLVPYYLCVIPASLLLMAVGWIFSGRRGRDVKEGEAMASAPDISGSADRAE